MIGIISVLPLSSNSSTQRQMTIQKLILSFCASLVLVLPSYVLADGPAVEVRRGLDYVERPSGKLQCDVYMPQGKGPFPGMLIVHGGAWRIGSALHTPAAATEL